MYLKKIKILNNMLTERLRHNFFYSNCTNRHMEMTGEASLGGVSSIVKGCCCPDATSC